MIRFGVSTVVLGLAMCGTLATPAASSAQSTEPGALQFRLGVAEGAPTELFGEVSGLEVDSAGRIYVMDRMENRIRVFGPDGRFLTQAGREGAGPGEFSYMSGSDITDDGALLIADPGNGRISRLRLRDDGALTTEAVIPLGFPPTDVCALGERMYVLRGPNLTGSEESGMIQEIDASGRMIRTFGAPLPTPEEDRRTIGEWNHMLNRGILACDSATGTVFFGRMLEPTLEAFDPEGRRKWGRVLDGFNRIKFGLTRGQCCWYAPDPELGSNHEVRELMTTEDGMLLVGIREVEPGPRTAENPRFELWALDKGTGRLLSRVGTNGLVRAIDRDGSYAVVENPFPQVLVHEWR